jgi:fatty acid desaturase
MIVYLTDSLCAQYGNRSFRSNLFESVRVTFWYRDWDRSWWSKLIMRTTWAAIGLVIYGVVAFYVYSWIGRPNVQASSIFPLAGRLIGWFAAIALCAWIECRPWREGGAGLVLLFFCGLVLAVIIFPDLREWFQLKIRG